MNIFFCLFWYDNEIEQAHERLNVPNFPLPFFGLRSHSLSLTHSLTISYIDLQALNVRESVPSLVGRHFSIQFVSYIFDFISSCKLIECRFHFQLNGIKTPANRRQREREIYGPESSLENVAIFQWHQHRAMFNLYDLYESNGSSSMIAIIYGVCVRYPKSPSIRTIGTCAHQITSSILPEWCMCVCCCIKIVSA